MNPIEHCRNLIASRMQRGKLEYPRRAASDPQDSHAMVFQVACLAVWGCDLSYSDARTVIEDFCAHSDLTWQPNEIAHKISQAETGGHDRERGHLLRISSRKEEQPGVSAEPRAPRAPGRPEIDMECVQDFIRGTPAIEEGWLRRRSPVDVAKVESGDFLNALFQQGERVLIFTEEHSQGNFLWVAGKPDAELLPGAEKETGLFGGWRLAQDRHTKAVRSALPRTGRLGIWYLVQPVSGKWEVKPDVKWTEAEGQWSKDVQGKYTRRSAVNVTAWRYLVLESDELPADAWLRVVANLPLPISALYTSGGRSIHALLRLPAGSKSQWDGVRDVLRAIVCPLGADAGALSAVRLSRLPGCFREGAMQKGVGYVRYPKARRQELLYLNPNPDGTPLLLRKEVRA